MKHADNLPSLSSLRWRDLPPTTDPVTGEVFTPQVPREWRLKVDIGTARAGMPLRVVGMTVTASGEVFAFVSAILAHNVAHAPRAVALKNLEEIL